MQKINIIAAIGNNGVIGNKGGLAWRNSVDLQHFKKTTLQKTVIMGRRTFESIGSKPLIARQNIILSSKLAETNNIEVCSSLDEAVEKANNEIWVIGGGQIYQLALDEGIVDEMVLTLIPKNLEGDTFFPEFREDEWANVGSVGHPDFTIVRFKNLKREEGL